MGAAVAIGSHLCSGPWDKVNEIISSSPILERPLHGHEKTAKFLKWPNSKDGTKATGLWPLPSDESRSWFDAMKISYGDLWHRAGIYNALHLSMKGVQGDRNLILAAASFWNSASNTFDFRFGQMSVTLLDVLVIGGFTIHHPPYIPGKLVNANFAQTYDPNLRESIKETANSYEKWIGLWKSSGGHEEHIAFLEFWLNKFVFCMSANRVTDQWTNLAQFFTTKRKLV